LYSKSPVHWDDFGEANPSVYVMDSAERAVQPLGDQGAVVLHFISPELVWRHNDMVAHGASHDYDAYRPHMTISFFAGDLDWSDAARRAAQGQGEPAH
jgi:hypothetical protein